MKFEIKSGCFWIPLTDAIILFSWMLVKIETMENNGPSPETVYSHLKRPVANGSNLKHEKAECEKPDPHAKRTKMHSMPLADSNVSSSSAVNVALSRSSLPPPDSFYSYQYVHPYGVSFREGRENCANVFPVPTAPPLRFTSTAFSDISLPIPNLSASKSFGPNGFLSSASTSDSVQKPLLCTDLLISSPAEQSQLPEQNPESTRALVSGDPADVNAGDLSLAASALLDLTPAVEEQQRFPFDEKSHNQKFSMQRQEDLVVKSEGAAGIQHNMAYPLAMHSHMAQKAAELAVRKKRLFEDVPLTLIACKCKNTKCLKLYCNCFQTGTFCDELICKCNGCNNTAEHSVPRGSRTRAINEILNRRIDAFEPRLKKKTGEGCSCKKSK